MTELPHLLVRATIELDGKLSCGVSADGLPPKWFTKNPDTTFEQDDLPNMLRVIRSAADLALASESQPSLFQWWWQSYRDQQAWANECGIEPLLAGFGTSLIERAVIDAFCRSSGTTLWRALRENLFGIDFGSIRDSLDHLHPRDLLPDAPSRQVKLRHTVGLADPLTDSDIVESDQPDDSLPYSLVSTIQHYGLSYFKVKLSGVEERDHKRLQRIAEVVSEQVGSTARFTLDGNENYENIDSFRQAWDLLRKSPVIRKWFDQSLLFVEQPLHRQAALDENVREALNAWQDSPPMIIDESDAELDSLPRALELGYSGTSHKNCKGIIKGLIGAATIAVERQRNPNLLLSAEDLGNVGPVALLQDLAMVAALGIDHVERNGHHYFAGLSMYPRSLQQQMVTHHGDLYQPVAGDFVSLVARDGCLSLDSTNAAPFGIAEHPDLSSFERWEF